MSAVSLPTHAPAAGRVRKKQTQADPELWQQFEAPEFCPKSAIPSSPVIVVGAGPVGIHAVRQLIAAGVSNKILLFSAEPHYPYNRVRLSSLVAGTTSMSAVDNLLESTEQVEQYFDCAITNIDRAKSQVTDVDGNKHHYSRLILALGARPRIPDIPGVKLPGVFTFRDMRDAQHLLARKLRSRHTVVLGGGLLGLEAAKAMAQFNTEVTVIEFSQILMVRQLDEEASRLLEYQLQHRGIKVLTNESITAVTGDARVTGVQLRSGQKFPCDTLIVATGIVPNIGLAREAQLPVGRGIRVNDQMQTADENIFAVGECCEHNGQTYGLLAPGLEHAAIASQVISALISASNNAPGNVPGSAVSAVQKLPARYRGSVQSTNLKAAGIEVRSFGRTGHDEPEFQFQTLIYSDRYAGIYRKLILFGGRLVGAIGVGEWPEARRLEEAAAKSMQVYPWQRWQFRNSGCLLREFVSDDIQAWSSSDIVCQCMGVTKGQLTDAVSGNCRSVTELRLQTGASSVCGSCTPLLQQLAGSESVPEPVPAARTLNVLGVIALLGTLSFFVLPQVPYASSVQSAVSFDWLWRDSFYKQLSGFGLLAVSAVLAMISLRKRLSDWSVGDFGIWRIIHVVTGAVVLALLLAHTGLRLGNNLNMYLMLCFCGLLVAGGVASLSMGLQDRLPTGALRVLRKNALLWHVLLLIPFPSLLAFHIFKTYWY